MQVEAQLVTQTIGRDDDVKAGTLHAEARTWARLFGRKYRRRTLIGIMMMFFQREPYFLPSSPSLPAYS